MFSGAGARAVAGLKAGFHRSKANGGTMYVQQGGADDEIGAPELRVLQRGAVVHREQQPLLALPVGDAHRRARRVHHEQGDQVRQLGVLAACLAEQAGEPARRVVRQVEQLQRGLQLPFGEAAVVRGLHQVRLGHLGTQVLPLHRRGDQRLHQITHPYRGGRAQSGTTREERVGGAGGLLDRQGQQRGEQLPVQIGAGAGRQAGERLAVLFGAEERAGLQQPRLQLGVSADAVLDYVDKLGGAGPVPKSFSHRMLAQEPVRTKGGTVRITDSSNFPASTTIAAALVEVEPGGMRELHWHPNGDEWQYYLSGKGRMTVFGSESKARTFDYQAGDVGYVPFAMGHYIENTGTETLTFLEMFKSPRYADVSLTQWMALTPHALVQAHTKLSQAQIDGLPTQKHPVVPG